MKLCNNLFQDNIIDNSGNNKPLNHFKLYKHLGFYERTNDKKKEDLYGQTNEQAYNPLLVDNEIVLRQKLGLNLEQELENSLNLYLSQFFGVELSKNILKKISEP